MPDYIIDLFLHGFRGVALILIITFFTAFVILPLVKKSLEQLTEEERNKKFFYKQYPFLKRMTFFTGFAVILVYLAMKAVSPSVLPKYETERVDSLSQIEKLDKEALRKTKELELSTEGVRDPLKGTGDESKKRIQELTEYKKTSFADSENKKDVDVDSLPNSSATQEKQQKEEEIE